MHLSTLIVDDSQKIIIEIWTMSFTRKKLNIICGRLKIKWLNYYCWMTLIYSITNKKNSCKIIFLDILAFEQVLNTSSISPCCLHKMQRSNASNWLVILGNCRYRSFKLRDFFRLPAHSSKRAESLNRIRRSPSSSQYRSGEEHYRHLSKMRSSSGVRTMPVIFQNDYFLWHLSLTSSSLFQNDVGKFH